MSENDVTTHAAFEASHGSGDAPRTATPDSVTPEPVAPDSVVIDESTTKGSSRQASATSTSAMSTSPRPGVDDTADGADSSPRPPENTADASRLGTPGPRLSRRSPFYIGFFGALGALLAWQLANMLAEVRSVLLLLVVSLYLAVGLNPLVEWFVRRRIRRGLAVALVFLGLLVLFGLVGLAIVPVVIEQGTVLVNERVPNWLDQLRSDPNFVRLDDQYNITQRLQDYLTGNSLAQRLFGGVLGAGRIVFSTLASVFTVLVLTLYFLGSLPATKRALYSLVPRSRRDRVSRLSDEILDRVGGYVGGQIAVAAIAAVAAFIFFMIVGLADYAVALAIVVAVLGLIPLIGGAISAGVATLVGLLTDPKIGIACLIYFIIYQQVENYLVYPRVMQRSVNVPGAVIVIAAMVGGSLLGIVGALLAVPTAAAILLIVREVIQPRLDAS
jgi:predicted PurR-regulated permease PerM